MRKKRFSFKFLIILVFVIFVILIAWDIFQYKKSGEVSEETNKILVKPEEKEIGECPIIDLSNYEITRIDDKSLELKVDLNGDQKEETLRVYSQISESGFRFLPIMLKIFSGNEECLKEEFTYFGEDRMRDVIENEVFDFQIFPDFWGNGRKTIMLIGQQTGYGPGYTLYMHFFALQNGKYQKIEGPELSSLSNYKFDEEIKGRKIIVAHGIWAEGEAHFDYHRYQFEIYTFDGEKYIQKLVGTTKDKYLGDIEEMLQKEPEVLNVP